MEIKWLEDFVTLADTSSFSRAAELRNVTQPAFSRRIKQLEGWLGGNADQPRHHAGRTHPGGTELPPRRARIDPDLLCRARGAFPRRTSRD